MLISIERSQFFNGSSFLTSLEHPQQMLEQNNFTRYNNLTILFHGPRPIHEFLEEWVRDDVGSKHVRSSSRTNINNMMIVVL